MRHHVRKAVEDTLQALKASGALKLEAMPAFSVDPPKQESHGDFSVNVAMMLSKPEGKKPRDIAELIASALTGAAVGAISDVQAKANAELVHQRIASLNKELTSLKHH